MSSYQSGPATKALAVTPSNTVNLANNADALYIGVTGDVTAVVNGVATLFPSVPAGIFPVTCSRVNAAGTTATGIVALYF